MKPRPCSSVTHRREPTCYVDFTPDAPDGLRVSMTAATIHGRSLQRDSFTWTVLTALVDEVVATVSASRDLTVSLAVHRSEAVRP